MSARHVSQVDRAVPTARGTHLLIPAGTQVVSRVEVRDAAGATVGVATLDDLLEELVGDIRDEHDEPAPGEPATAP